MRPSPFEDDDNDTGWSWSDISSDPIPSFVLALFYFNQSTKSLHAVWDKLGDHYRGAKTIRIVGQNEAKIFTLTKMQDTYGGNPMHIYQDANKEFEARIQTRD
jgi:hypothetical protein